MSESSNRAFMYGESVFTTMRMKDGQLCDWEYHFDRLKKGVEFVYGPFTDGENWAYLLKDRLESYCFRESGDRVLRLAIYREQERGLVRKSLVSIGGLKVSLSSTPFDASRIEGKMLKLRTCATFIRPYWWPSFLKAGNYLETILSQKLNLKAGDDDVLFLSPQDTVLESSVANIFVVRHNKLYTAPTGPNVLDGIMRRKVIDVASLFFESFEESASTLEQLFNADAVFGTNCLRGPFLVSRVDGYEFTYSKEFLNMFENLRQKVIG